MKYSREILLIAGSLVAGIMLAAIMTEVTYRFQTRAQDRDGKVVTLVIPLGTAQRVEDGDASPAIPEDMVIVAGDKLRIVNEDNVNHTFGPLFIPSGTTAEMAFTKPDNLAFACTFTPDKYLGLEIKEPLTLYTRVMGILSAGIPLGTLLALYIVFAIRPGLKSESSKSENRANA